MVALAIVVLAVISFGMAGAFLGYDKGFDKGFEAAIECFEEEVKNVQSDNDF